MWLEKFVRGWIRRDKKVVQQKNAVKMHQKGEETSLSSDFNKSNPPLKSDNSCQCQEKDFESDVISETESSQSAWEQIVASANAGNEALVNNIKPPSDIPLEDMQLALSFRADLPSDVPPTMSAECVKYFYSAVLVVTTVEGDVSTGFLFLALHHNSN